MNGHDVEVELDQRKVFIDTGDLCIEARPWTASTSGTQRRDLRAPLPEDEVEVVIHSGGWSVS